MKNSLPHSFSISYSNSLLNMAKTFSQDFTQPLLELMQRLGFSSYRQLCQSAGVSEKQLRRLRQGQIGQFRVETLLKLAQALQLSVNELLEMFSPKSTLSHPSVAGGKTASLEALQQEYQRLQQQLHQQREILRQEFQQSSIQVLESWMRQWPTAAYAAKQNEQLPAVRLLPLVRPVEQLLQEWGVEAIATVGAQVPYDPQWHQLSNGTAQPGELVKVRYTGYRQAEKLLYRAEVSLIGNPSNA
ncbi:MAG TPA: helix-turn-helix domain-containing protein [Waterburya sp.]|jgi:DNA-binding Xre family transcriptional regulator